MASKKSRLEQAAAEATKIFFSGADAGEPETVSKASQRGAKTGAKAKTTRGKAKAVEPVMEAVKAPQTGGATVVFSFRANPDDVTRFKAYAKARQGVTLAEVGTAAMNEYMKRHKLTDAEMAIYDLEIKKADMLKNL